MHFTVKLECKERPVINKKPLCLRKINFFKLISFPKENSEFFKARSIGGDPLPCRILFWLKAIVDPNPTLGTPTMQD